jgi:phenylacetate-CoA ligase
VRWLIVVGEPGGNIPATRDRLEQHWGARVIDHHGATEVGPLSFECVESPGFLHVNEREYICEVLDRKSGRVAGEGEAGELVVTNLGRTACPVIRYRSGDVVVLEPAPCACGRTFARLKGGILARADDMINIRGVNVYPASIESIVRRFDEVAEFRSVVSNKRSLRSLTIEIEAAPGADASDLATRVSQQFRLALGLTVPVQLVAHGTLPRFEMKSRRFIVED